MFARGAFTIGADTMVKSQGCVPDTGRYNDIKLKILRFSRKGVGCGEGKNLFSREKKDNGADVRPPPRDTLDPYREQRVTKGHLI